MNVLVTGCAGFIGWKTAEFLLADRHAVIGVDNLDDAYDVRLKEWRLSQLRPRMGFRFQQLDITDRDSVAQFLRENSFEAVINLAARAGVRQSLRDPWVYYETNLTGALNLLELCKDHHIRKFLQASTSSVYGDGERPFREDQLTDRPPSPYAASKKATEALCYTYHRLYGLDVTVLRYFTVYGPAGRPDMSPFRFVKWIVEGELVTLYGDGSQVRDFTHVDDVARATILGLRPLGYEIVNIGSDQPVPLNDVIRLIENLTGKKATFDCKPRHPADVVATWADISKAERLLHWRPQYTLQAGLASLVSWYKDNREWASLVVTG